MSGHSKWSTIKRQKGANDSARGQLFTKLAAKITVAVRDSGGITDPESNFKLRLAAEKAKAANMPKENIARAISRGENKANGEEWQEIVYEGFAPFTVAVLVEVVTNNCQRTTSQLKNLFTTHGGIFGLIGSVNYLFKHLGEISVAKTVNYDEMLALSLEAEAEDLEEAESEFLIYTQAKKVHQVKTVFAIKGLKVQSAELIYKPLAGMVIDDSIKVKKVLAFLEMLESCDDVHRVYSTLEIPTKLL